MFNIRKDGPANDKGMTLFGRKGSHVDDNSSRAPVRKSTVVTTTTTSEVIVRNNDIDEGVIAFGMWLSCQEAEGGSQKSGPIFMDSFIHDKLVILHDAILQKQVIVRIVEGVPNCEQCLSSDCAHVGFSICAEQMHRRFGLN